ncbi:hypothetical protein COB57_04760 [Candidatus Peregrinibacteria bacterium]|nr:MAG: hypothetical protein COB57_04760 [Candidatus Peregrinibacteria bacterium]
MEYFEPLLILMVVIYTAGRIFDYLSLPIIFGELLGGFLLGPVFHIIPPDLEIVKILAELGIFFLMFHSGLETDPNELLHASKKSFLVALLGILFPLGGGYLISQYFGYTASQSFFIGVSLSITAIAISVRLFKDCGLQGTPLSHIVLGAAVIDDIISLILFSISLKVAEAGFVDWGMIGMMIIKIIAFFSIVLFIGNKGKKLLSKILKKKGFTFAFIMALTLGIIAEHLGLHIIIGAFLAGLFINEGFLDKKIFDKIEDRIYGLSYSFLGPIFFVSLAFHLDFTALIETPVLALSITGVAILGKVVGSGLAAYVQNISKKDSFIIGLAMNGRGAVELIIASIGLKAGIIDTEIFSVLVFMAFATTLISILGIKFMTSKSRASS